MELHSGIIELQSQEKDAVVTVRLLIKKLKIFPLGTLT
jgi:hypothetical protein